MTGMLQRVMAPFIDGNDLVCPTREEALKKRGCDNGVLYGSYYLMLQRFHGEELDKATIEGIKNCIGEDGYLHRAPDDPLQDAPDDHYGLFAMALVCRVRIPRVKLPWRCMHPMLIYMRVLITGGLPELIARLFSPLMGLIISLSNLTGPKDTSNRLLTWAIIKGTSTKSGFCALGGFFWNLRNDSVKVAKEYFSENPMGDWWIK